MEGQVNYFNSFAPGLTIPVVTPPTVYVCFVGAQGQTLEQTCTTTTPLSCPWPVKEIYWATQPFEVEQNVPNPTL